jgi:phosphoribosyl 1,2-cyclic phosphate phosphodiesterase
MQLTFLGTGPSRPVGKEKDARTRSSLYVTSDRGRYSFMIDCTPDFLEQVERENIDDIDFILISHGHNDATKGLGPQLKKWLDKKDLPFMPVYFEEQTWKKIKEDFKELSHIKPNFFKAGEPFSPAESGDNLLIRPFRLIHSIQPGYPMSGFRFKKIVYTEDVGEIPPESLRYYKNSDILVYDAAMWFGEQIKGHQNAGEALEFAKKICPDKFILTQAGHTYPPQEEAEKEIRKRWEKIKGECKSEIVLAHDGLKITTKELISESLMEQREAIYLVHPHGSLIWEGKKSLIVKSKFYKGEINKPLYLIEDNLCYGIIKLRLPDKITLEEFNSLKDRHLVSEEERSKWWPNKEVLYAYKFDIIKLFDFPKKVEIPRGAQTFIKDFKFLSEHEFIENVPGYHPRITPTDVLMDDWRIVIAWYSSIKSGKKFKYTIGEVLELARKIFNELRRRGIEFHPEKMTPAGKEVYDIVSKSKGKGALSETLAQLDYRNPDMWENFKDITVIKGFASIVGSSIKSADDHKPNDLDIQFRMRDPPDFIKRAIEVRICKDFPNWKDLHFIWGDPEGPHDSFVPLYDLRLVRVRPVKKVEMSDLERNSEENSQNLEENPRKIVPMKPKRRFYRVDEIIDYMFKTGRKYALEKKYNGFRGMISKFDNSVKIYSDQGKDISEHFKTAVSEAKKISNKDFILDCEIVYKDGGRSEIAKYITGKGEIPDKEISFHCFDIPHFDKDISELPWFERKQILHSLNFTPHIKEVSSIVAETSEKARKAITLLRNLKGSEGAMIKRYEGRYSPGAESDAWIKFRNEDELTVEVLKVNKKEKGYTYSIGIPVNDTGKFKENYIENGFLLLGDTFITDEEFSEGDKIQVNIEEVWRHEYPDNKIRFSIHKPRVIRQSDSEYSKWTDLDELAVSKGELVTENSDTTTSTPGIASVQGKYIIKRVIRQPNREDESVEVDPSNLNDKSLTDAWETYEELYSEHKSGKKIPISIEAVINYASLVFKEIMKRGLDYEFNDSDLFGMVGGGETGLSEELQDKGVGGKETGVKEEGGTRSEAALDYWENNWWKAYPESGKGKFIYHHHWRGLDKEDTDKSDDWFMDNTDKSIHGDLRFEGRNDNLFGFTVFLGSTRDNRTLPEKDKLINLSKNKGKEKNLQGTWKLPQPKGWVEVAKDKPLISEPRGVGATEEKYAKFFAPDSGTFEMGVWREHFFELFLKGKDLNGRMLIQYAPIAGRRIWIIDFPEDQTPYAETHDLEKIKAELKKKGQKHLIWAKPGEKPELITISENEDLSKLNKPFRLPKGSSKKFGVYVKDKSGKVIKVTFGDPDMEIKRDNPEARKNFRARHKCDTAKDPTTARYWSCKMWEEDFTVSDIIEGK